MHVPFKHMHPYRAEKKRDERCIGINTHLLGIDFGCCNAGGTVRPCLSCLTCVHCCTELGGCVCSHTFTKITSQNRGSVDDAAA